MSCLTIKSVLPCLIVTYQVGEGRALYNLGNIYYTKGKLLAKPAERDPGEFPNEVKECLLKAVHFYEYV